MIARRFRRLLDGREFEAVQYGKPGIWSSDAAADVTKFLLGLDVNAGVTVANEHMLDVVTPVRKRWMPGAGVADISIVDPTLGIPFQLKLGDWVVRLSPRDSLVIVENQVFIENYEEITPTPPKSEFDELADIIYASFSALEGELYQALAETAAKAVLKAGWSRKD